MSYTVYIYCIYIMRACACVCNVSDNYNRLSVFSDVDGSGHSSPPHSNPQ